MKPQRQLIEHCPEEGRYGDCQRTCVAAILDMDAADVPHFCDYGERRPRDHPENWEKLQNAWLAERGLGTFTIAYSGRASFEQVMEWTSKQSPTVPMILMGKSRSGGNHVVVVLNGEIVCDPSGNGIVGPSLDNTWEVQVLAAISGVPAEVA